MTTARLHQLSNGVRVVSDPMAGLESLALSIVVRGGARWERESHNGWSHLLEHMVFKGAGDRSARDIVELIEQAGGQINAETGYERTSYQVRCLKGGLPTALAVLTDLVRRPRLEAEDLEREKAVIAQEIAEAADAPDDRVFDLAQARAFANQALGRPILGSVESLRHATPEALAAYHSALYAPERIVISAAGAVDEDELLALVEREFGDARPGPASSTATGVEAPQPAHFATGHAVETRKLEQAQLVILLPSVGVRDPDYFTSRLFAEALGGGMSSRLFQEAREARGLAYAIDAYSESYEDCGVLGVYAGTAANDCAKTARLVGEQLAALTQTIDERELDRAKAQLKANLFMARESPLSRAEQSAGQVILFNALFTPTKLAEALEAVEIADLKRFGAERLSDERCATAVLGPKSAAGAGRAFKVGI